MSAMRNHAFALALSVSCLVIAGSCLAAGKRLYSYGLGASEKQLEQLYGTPKRSMGELSYRGGKISYMPGRFEYSFESAQPLSDARRMTTQFYPEDARLLRSWKDPERKEFFELRRSKSLSTHFKDQSGDLAGKHFTIWEDAKPGTFIVIYRIPEGSVTSVVIGCGDNP